MSKEWLDYPVGVFRLAARTAIGGILLSVVTCVTSGWLYILIAANQYNLQDGFKYLSIPSLTETAVMTLTLIPAIGILSLYGIPILWIQLGCVSRILQEENTLHDWFILAYCQMLLTYIWLSKAECGSFWGWHLASLAATLFVLGIIHGFLAWMIMRRLKLMGRASHDVVKEKEEKGNVP